MPFKLFFSDSRRGLGTEHEAHLPGIHYGLVLVAVIEQDMHLSRLSGEFANLFGPGLEFLLGVEVIEPLSGADTSLFPRFGVPAMETDQAYVRGCLGDRRHTGLEALGLVHAHEGQVIFSKKGQRPVHVPAIEPGVVTKLDCHPILR